MATSYVVNGHKNWTSRIEAVRPAVASGAHHAARRGRPTARAGSACFSSTCATAVGRARSMSGRSRTMFNYETYQVTYRDLRLPADT